MRLNLVGAFVRNRPFGTELAFASGLRKIGVYVNEVDPSYPDQSFLGEPDATIVFKYLEPGPTGYRDAFREVLGPKIVYQPDDVAFPHIQQMMQEMREHCEHALMYDDRGVRFARELGYKKVSRLLLTADPILYHPIPGIQKDVDVCFVGSLTGGANHASRVRMCQIVAGMGLKAVFRGDIYDIGEINRIYNRSRVVLNHATDVGQPFGQGFGYQCRHFEAGMAGACVLSNEVTNRQDGDPTMMFTFGGERSLVERLGFLIGNPDLCLQQGADLYEEMVESHLPVHRAQEIVEFVRSLG